jgi:hypothetical protein
MRSGFLFSPFGSHNSLMSEQKKCQEQGTRAPQIDQRIVELKEYLRSIMDDYEVDPRNEWAIKAHHLV